MKKSIQLSSPDYNNIIPIDVAPQQQPSSLGMSMDNLSPEESAAIPDEGKAMINYKVHHRTSEAHIHPKTGEKSEKHSVRMHVHNFEPQEAEQPKKKKLTESTNAQDAVRSNFEPDGNP